MSACSYDFFKAELLKSGYFQDNIYLHTTASFAAGTVATTVCSPADVLKVCLILHVLFNPPLKLDGEPC